MHPSSSLQLRTTSHLPAFHTPLHKQAHICALVQAHAHAKHDALRSHKCTHMRTPVHTPCARPCTPHALRSHKLPEVPGNFWST
eukprot:1176466-Prorocentrum_lima.AAC.1